MKSQLFTTKEHIDLSNAFSIDGRIKKSIAKSLNKEGFKWCGRCKELKILDAFGPLANRWDGLQPVCIECKRYEGRQYIKDNSEKIARRQRVVKSKMVEKFGGKCSRCGYNEFVAGLDFHHVSRQTKSFGIAQLLTASTPNTMYKKNVMKEIDKCALLCSNCHKSIGMWKHTVRWEKMALGWRLVPIDEP
jgi:hypothetical protein